MCIRDRPCGRASRPSPHFLDPFGGGIPNQFVNLQAEARGDVVGEDPLGEFLGIEQAVRSVARAGGGFFECRRKQNGVDAFGQTVAHDEVASEFVIGAVGQYKLDFIVRAERFEIFERERVRFSGMRTLHVYDLDDLLGNMLQGCLLYTSRSE